MDAELKQFLEQMEARLTDQGTQLRAEMGQLRADVDSRIGRLEAEIDSRFGQLEAEIGQLKTDLTLSTSVACEKVETTLLKEFYKWGRTSDMRMRQTMADVVVQGERLLNAEDRITDIERSKLPPQADAA